MPDHAPNESGDLDFSPNIVLWPAVLQEEGRTVLEVHPSKLQTPFPLRCCRKRAASPQPFRKGCNRAKKYRSAHPETHREPVPETYKEPCPSQCPLRFPGIWLEL